MTSQPRGLGPPVATRPYSSGPAPSAHARAGSAGSGGLPARRPHTSTGGRRSATTVTAAADRLDSVARGEQATERTHPTTTPSESSTAPAAIAPGVVAAASDAATAAVGGGMATGGVDRERSPPLATLAAPARNVLRLDVALGAPLPFHRRHEQQQQQQQQLTAPTTASSAKASSGRRAVVRSSRRSPLRRARGAAGSCIRSMRTPRRTSSRHACARRCGPSRRLSSARSRRRSRCTSRRSSRSKRRRSSHTRCRRAAHGPPPRSSPRGPSPTGQRNNRHLARCLLPMSRRARRWRAPRRRRRPAERSSYSPMCRMRRPAWRPSLREATAASPHRLLPTRRGASRRPSRSRAR